jgi:hypothetical protein
MTYVYNNVYVIEHPSRGVLMEIDFDEKCLPKPRFSWSRPRTEGWLFYSREQADKNFKRLPDKVRSKCTIIELKLRRRT